MNIFKRSRQDLNLSVFKDANTFVHQDKKLLSSVPDDQYILRMMIKSPWSNGYAIPDSLEWLKDTILEVDNWQQNLFHNHPFVYITVRAGIVRSITDDEWHVDGFSMRKPHLPEQNYVWSNCFPTEFLDQKFDIPKDFDPFVHNLHTYFQDNADNKNVYTAKEQHICIIDPYIVHRRPKVPTGTHRCFFRISHVPIEIEDDTCTQNLLLPFKVYNRPDIRNNLIAYQTTN